MMSGPWAFGSCLIGATILRLQIRRQGDVLQPLVDSIRERFGAEHSDTLQGGCYPQGSKGGFVPEETPLWN
jgi:hypothetical protein